MSGFFANAARLHPSGTYRFTQLLRNIVFCCSSSGLTVRTIRDDYPLEIHPTSVLFGEKLPQWYVGLFGCRHGNVFEVGIM